MGPFEVGRQILESLKAAFAAPNKIASKPQINDGYLLDLSL